MIIINLLALLVILVAGAVAGVMLTIRYAERGHAERRTDGDPPGDIRDPPAPWVTLRNDAPGRRESGTRDSRDRLPI
jgi:hypothetical protein